MFINGIGLVLVFMISFPGDVPIKLPNRIDNLVRMKDVTFKVRTTVCTFSVGTNPTLNGAIMLTGTPLVF